MEKDTREGRKLASPNASSAVFPRCSYGERIYAPLDPVYSTSPPCPGSHHGRLHEIRSAVAKGELGLLREKNCAFGGDSVSLALLPVKTPRSPRGTSARAALAKSALQILLDCVQPPSPAALRPPRRPDSVTHGVKSRVYNVTSVLISCIGNGSMGRERVPELACTPP